VAVIVRKIGFEPGNVTGVSVDTGPSIHGKRIELLRELFPTMKKAGGGSGSPN
jgi:putative ABC transport system substrate-binding protein